jgi:hypothetical protein
MKLIFGTLLSIWLLAACGGSTVEQTLDIRTKYDLAIVDSILVKDVLINYPMIGSVNPQSGNLLISSIELSYSDEPKLWEISPQGSLIRTIDLSPEGPSGVGMILSYEYFEDGYSLLGYNKLAVMDAELEAKILMDLPPASTSTIYSGINHLKSIKTPLGEQLLYFHGPLTTALISQPEYYRDWHFLSLVNTDELKVEPFGRLHPESKFNQGRAYYGMLSKFDVAGDKLKAVVDTDTVLYTFDANGNIISHHGIPFDKFIVEKGYTMGPTGFKEQNDPRDEAGNISSLLHVDGFDIIQYTSGLTYAAFTDIVGVNRENYDRVRLRQANPNKTIILKEGQLVSDYLTLPERIFELSHASPDGYLWATQNTAALEEEPDGLVLYKVAILPVK